MGQLIEAVLTCANRQEAEKIADILLEQKLVACVEFTDITSKYHWQNKIESAAEVKLTMKTTVEKFDEIEKIVNQLHSYDTFVLQAVPVLKLNKKAEEWINESTDS